MSKIISFSADDYFADNIDAIMTKSGYKNRSRFLRDAAIHFAEFQQRGELEDMEDEEVVEGHLIIYYQHGIEGKLLDIRHSQQLNVSAYNHSCLKHSHTCVDVMQAIGTAIAYRNVIRKLQNTPSVDKVAFISSPLREEGCC